MNARFTCLISKDELLDAIESLVDEDGWTTEDLGRLHQVLEKLKTRFAKAAWGNKDDIHPTGV
ncbi:MAG: hypothetical protein M0R80_02100 [Proteobacteria bacterium]|jgi:hypothetical protein|nr:hypothetical protein [Pseudomonadota bacterium]